MSDEGLTLLTKEQVCEMLGVKESWLNAQIKEGNIQYIRLGKKKFVRFRPEHVAQFLDERVQGGHDDNGDGTPV